MKKRWFYILLTVVALAVITAGTVVTSQMADTRPCRDVTITVRDSSSVKFVNEAELWYELGRWPAEMKRGTLSRVDIDSLERFLRSIDKLEWAEVNIRPDSTIHIEVGPMRPVARIFDKNGSYYINRDGKRISALARYFMDVPVIQGEFTDSFPAVDILPLVDYIAADSTWNKVISMIKVDSPTNVILVPVFRGHVINFGEPTGFADKFRRVKAAYAKIMPAMGWDYYDTLSVKWNGQIVATRRKKELPKATYDDGIDEADADISTMLATEGAVAGQSLPGKKIEADRPMPGEKPAVVSPSKPPSDDPAGSTTPKADGNKPKIDNKKP